jgi:hypothetical protein
MNAGHMAFGYTLKLAKSLQAHPHFPSYKVESITV